MLTRVSFIIVNYNTKQLVSQCLESIQRYTADISHEIIIVDNASSDGSVEHIQLHYPEAILIAEKINHGFGVANNIGARKAQGEYLFLLNSDATLHRNTLISLLEFLQKNPETGMVGPNVQLPDGQRQPKICGYLPTLSRICCDSFLLSALFPNTPLFTGMYLEHPSRETMEVEWISGVAMLIRRIAYEQVQGFNPAIFLYSEDMEFCHRLRKENWSIYHMTTTSISHFCGGSSPDNNSRARNSRLQQHHFLLLLELCLPRHQLTLAKCILGTGLLIRLSIASAALLFGRKNASFLFKSSWGRLADLLHTSSTFRLKKK